MRKRGVFHFDHRKLTAKISNERATCLIEFQLPRDEISRIGFVSTPQDEATSAERKGKEVIADVKLERDLDYDTTR